MTGELFKAVTSGKGIAFLVVAWGLPVASAMATWWVTASDDWDQLLPATFGSRIDDAGLQGGWLFLVVWAALTLALGLNARNLFRLYEGYLFPSFVQRRRSSIHWLRRESMRLSERVRVARERDDAGIQPSSESPSMDAMEAEKLAVDAQLRDQLRWFGRAMAHLPFRQKSNWRDYPTTEGSTMPTLLGNRIRAFERYGNARYGLDVLVLWYEFVGSAEDRVREEIEGARQGAEIFLAASVCSAGLSFATLVPLIWRSTWSGAPVSLLVVGLVALMLSIASYRKTVDETDEWGAAVTGLVNTHRGKVAAALGFVLPDNLKAERLFWTAVTGFVRTGSENWAKRLDAFERLEPAKIRPPSGQAG